MRITESHLRQVIRAVINEDVNPGSGMSMAIQKGENKISLNNKKIVEDELTKTYDWFKNTVFPAVESDEWPIIADQDYTILFDSSFWQKKMIGNTSEGRIFLKKGTQFLGINDKQSISMLGSARLAGGNYTPVDLREIYDLLEEEVVNHKLNVPMESFPG